MCENWIRCDLPCGCSGYIPMAADSYPQLHCDRKPHVPDYLQKPHCEIFERKPQLHCDLKPYDPGYLQKPHCEIFERKPQLQISDEKYKRKLSATGFEFEASPKKLKSLLDDEDDTEDKYDDVCNTQAWLCKPIKSWTLLDTKNWLYLTSQEMGLLYREISPMFARPGEELLLLSLQDFVKIDRNFGGMLYDSLHQILVAESSVGNSENRIRLKSVSEIKVEPRSDEETLQDSVYRFPDEESLLARYQSVKKRSEESSQKKTSTRTSTRKSSSTSKSKSAKTTSNTSTSKSAKTTPSTSTSKSARTTSSTRTNVRTSGLKIWEFIRNLLLDPQYCPSWIRWEDYKQKTFRFIENEKIARLWGSRNHNRKMNYRDFSRAMRYHYRMNKLAIVRPPRKLVYKFGPEAIGLETDDPNFYKIKDKAENISSRSFLHTQSQKDECRRHFSWLKPKDA